MVIRRKTYIDPPLGAGFDVVGATSRRRESNPAVLANSRVPVNGPPGKFPLGIINAGDVGIDQRAFAGGLAFLLYPVRSPRDESFREAVLVTLELQFPLGQAVYGHAAGGVGDPRAA